MAEPIDVDDNSFDEVVLKAETPVLVDFWAPWCGPCQMIAPLVKELASEYQDRVTFAKVNVDENPRSATKFGIRAIPTLLIFRDGQPVKQVVGFTPKGELKKQLDAVL
ncbi:MAG TPA: thioredoxin [Dehalococcoidia bacterium]|jgi:thioredoxin 1|nr:thioredoxin [Dehalococcoidia bacterium]